MKPKTLTLALYLVTVLAATGAAAVHFYFYFKTNPIESIIFSNAMGALAGASWVAFNMLVRKSRQTRSTSPNFPEVVLGLTFLSMLVLVLVLDKLVPLQILRGTISLLVGSFWGGLIQKTGIIDLRPPRFRQ